MATVGPSGESDNHLGDLTRVHLTDDNMIRVPETARSYSTSARNAGICERVKLKFPDFIVPSWCKEELRPSN